jgi:Stigma-specific protein, Stig1
VDDRRFDSLTRSLAATGSRRLVLKLIATTAIGGLATACGAGSDCSSSIGCPKCGKCTAYSLQPSSQTLAGTPCEDSCAAATLCTSAHDDSDYIELERYLKDHGFEGDSEPEMSRLIEGGKVTNEVLTSGFRAKGGGSTATLGFSSGPQGRSYALVSYRDDNTRLLFIDGEGSVQTRSRPDDSWEDMDNPGGFIDWSDHCKWCSTVCKTGGAISCELLAILVCAKSKNPTVCAMAAKEACKKTGDKKCDDYCKSVASGPGGLDDDLHNCGSCGNKCTGTQNCCQGKCSDRLRDNDNCGGCGNKCPAGQVCCTGRCEKPEFCCPPDDPGCKGTIYCGCNSTCYDDINACTNECHATLGCLGPICAPQACDLK